MSGDVRSSKKLSRLSFLFLPLLDLLNPHPALQLENKMRWCENFDFLNQRIKYLFIPLPLFVTEILQLYDLNF